LEKFAARIQNLLRENVLLTVDPQIGETFLSGIEDLSEVAECTLFVENLVGFGKLFTVISWGTTGFVNLA
jgi:hypothetical protein